MRSTSRRWTPRSTAYAAALPELTAWARERWPQDATTSDLVYRQTIRAKVCDLLRGMLPAATVSNVGIFASGQAYEGLLLRLAGHPLAEARTVGDALLGELRNVIPSFLTRVDRPDRGGVWAAYLAGTRDATRQVATELVGGLQPLPVADEVTLVSWGPPDAEVELVTGMLYPHTDLPEAQLRRRVEAMTAAERQRVVRAYAGDRTNRRHKPGRALERITYRFDVLSDYGAFRDLQRHRMMTIEWQPLSPRHGYEVPDEVDQAGLGAAYRSTLDRLADLHAALRPGPARPGAVRGRPRPPHALQHPLQRPRRDADDRAAHDPAGPRHLPPHLPAHARPHRRRASAGRRAHDLR